MTSKHRTYAEYESDLVLMEVLEALEEEIPEDLKQRVAITREELKEQGYVV